MGLRLGFFGQAAFGKDVLVALADAGHTIACVYVPPDSGRPDALATEAEQRGVPQLRYERFRRKGLAIPEVVAEYRELRVDLNVLAFVTAILPNEIIDGPPHKSICFHPSLLPRFRGGAALAWQVIEGEKESGVTIFRPDDGVDTGPIVVQRGGVSVANHTAGSLYFEHLYGMGVEAMVEAVASIDAGTATFEPQDPNLATSQGLVDDDAARIDWSLDAERLDRLIRGCDPQPGAFGLRGGEKVRLFGVRLLPGDVAAEPGTLLGVEDGALLVAVRGGRLAASKLKIGDGRKVAAAEAGLAEGERLT